MKCCKQVAMEGGSATVAGAVAGAVFGALAGYRWDFPLYLIMFCFILLLSHCSKLPASWLGQVEVGVKEAVDKRINHLLDLMGIP